jgi:HlyD family secretion protein
MAEMLEARNPSNSVQDGEIERNLGLDAGSGHRRHLWRWLVLLGLALIVGLGLYRWIFNSGTPAMQYKTQPAVRADLTLTVSATGNLQPTNQVDVGSELSGTIRTVEVDYNDHVTVGQVLAKLDTAKLQAQVLQSQAALASAMAKVKQVQATVKQSTSDLDRLAEVRRLSNGKAVSPNDLDAAQATLDRAQADLAAAQAAVAQAQATLELNQTDLSKAVIRSPINGVVLVRSVEPGQTVAASLQSPVLFTLAEDLTQMELHVDVDEADVGQVEKGQEATFTVDAYPERSFPARITQVRFGSKTVDGVVTYETVLAVDNSDQSLRPGMTATAEITVKKIKDALLIPNAALRFSPPAQQKADSTGNGSILSRLFPRPRWNRIKQKEEKISAKTQRQVWTLTGEELTPLTITIGSTDGIMTQVIQGDLKPGMKLVVDTEG